MAHLVFYEKPECGGNARQRAVLQAAGHTLERRDLLAERWTRDTLLAFLAPLPVADWFNRSAPRVKSGEVVPETLAAERALALLLAAPLLIRRPLMHHLADDSRHVGFDTAAVAAWIGLGDAPERAASLEGCSAVRTPCSPPLMGGSHATV